MSVKTIVKKNTYYDSVSLMAITSNANKLEGVKQAVIAMGTDLNKEVLQNVGLYSDEIAAAGTGDLMLVIEAEAGTDMDALLARVEELFTKKKRSGGGDVTYATIESAAKHIPDANLAIISVPGAFAAREARKALENGLNVLMFSDNVSIEDEVALKKQAHEKGLFMMGPDCGTAILNHVPLCFANAVRPGNIGIVGASGTGSQEVSVRIHDFGGGITQVIGTGGRDLSEAVGGIMMIDGIRALAKDEATKVIVLVSKTPAKSVEEKVLGEIKGCNKPVVVCFIGGSEEAVAKAGGIYAKTMKEAALKAVILGGKKEEEIDLHSLNLPLIKEIQGKLKPEQRWIRALLCGGTLCQEMFNLAAETLKDVHTNIAKDPAHMMRDIHKSEGHVFIDFGDDAFTQGKPHPMIDPSLRTARFLEEAKDPTVGVIILDFILGYGAHSDPVGEILPAIKEAKALAAREGRHLEILGYVLGTDADPQDFNEQVEKMMAADVTWASSCTNSGLLARGFVEKGE